jgi:hypothetical protein
MYVEGEDAGWFAGEASRAPVGASIEGFAVAELRKASQCVSVRDIDT